MARIFSVDAAVGAARSFVELRGELYAIKDLPLSERMRLQYQLYEEQARREAEIAARREAQEQAQREAEERGEEVPAADADEGASFEELREITKRAVQEALDGVPDDVANSLTEIEWEAILSAIKASRTRGPIVTPERQEAVPAGKS